MQPQPLAQVMLTPDQLITLSASAILREGMTIPEAVSLAIDVLVETTLNAGIDVLKERMQQRDPAWLAEEEAKQQASRRGLMVPNGPIDPNLLKRNRRQEA